MSNMMCFIGIAFAISFVVANVDGSHTTVEPCQSLCSPAYPLVNAYPAVQPCCNDITPAKFVKLREHIPTHYESCYPTSSYRSYILNSLCGNNWNPCQNHYSYGYPEYQHWNPNTCYSGYQNVLPYYEDVNSCNCVSPVTRIYIYPNEECSSPCYNYPSYETISVPNYQDYNYDWVYSGSYPDNRCCSPCNDYSCCEPITVPTCPESSCTCLSTCVNNAGCNANNQYCWNPSYNYQNYEPSCQDYCNYNSFYPATSSYTYPNQCWSSYNPCYNYPNYEPSCQDYCNYNSFYPATNSYVYPNQCWSSCQDYPSCQTNTCPSYSDCSCTYPTVNDVVYTDNQWPLACGNYPVCSNDNVYSNYQCSSPCSGCDDLCGNCGPKLLKRRYRILPCEEADPATAPMDAVAEEVADEEATDDVDVNTISQLPCTCQGYPVCKKIIYPNYPCASPYSSCAVPCGNCGSNCVKRYRIIPAPEPAPATPEVDPVPEDDDEAPMDEEEMADEEPADDADVNAGDLLPCTCQGYPVSKELIYPYYRCASPYYNCPIPCGNCGSNCMKKYWIIPASEPAPVAPAADPVPEDDDETPMEDEEGDEEEAAPAPAVVPTPAPQCTKKVITLPYSCPNQPIVLKRVYVDDNNCRNEDICPIFVDKPSC